MIGWIIRPFRCSRCSHESAVRLRGALPPLCPSRSGIGAQATEGKPKAVFAFVPAVSRSWQAAHDRFWRFSVAPHQPYAAFNAAAIRSATSLGIGHRKAS